MADLQKGHTAGSIIRWSMVRSVDWGRGCMAQQSNSEIALQRNCPAAKLRGWCIYMYSCSALLIAFEIKLTTTDFKENE